MSDNDSQPTNILVVYSSREEVLVTTPEDEAKVVEEYFTDTGRRLDDYDRMETRHGAVLVTFHPQVSGG